MIYRLRLFGYEVASLEVEPEECDQSMIAGGGSHNFERDMDPLDPTAGEEWEWDDRKKFGFQ